jgi:SAM-dependent MidA family methyltransferase
VIARVLGRLGDECGGSIPFDRFMRAALYDPDVGYYTGRIRTVGSRGDFSTWPGLDSSLAGAVAAWLRESSPRHVIEVGAGSGRLAADMLGRLGWIRRRLTTLHIVEISPVLRREQQQLLRHRRVAWHDTMQDALRAAGGKADIYSNELADAFPCRVFIRHSGAWLELALHIGGGSARENPVPCALPRSSAFGGNPPDGARVEVHESYRRWLASWAPMWTAGRMLTVDYGAQMPALYHRRPEGTLRAYAHHQRLTGPDVYASFGRRDITADVNFTDLRTWGEDLGWTTDSLGTLSEFIASRRPRIRLPDAFAAPGESFQALVQSRSSSVDPAVG